MCLRQPVDIRCAIWYIADEINTGFPWKYHCSYLAVFSSDVLGGYINNKMQCKKLGQFAMPETCENWLGLLNSCVWYAHHTCEIYQVLAYSVDFEVPPEIH